MLPEIARRAIEFYSEPGQTVLDPMCGIGTTLIEAIHQDRCALGLELEARWAALAAGNVGHARAQGATGSALVLTDDARCLGRGVLDEYAGKVSLILTSPPYGDVTLGDPRGGKGMKVARACEGRRVTGADRAHAATRSKTCRYGDSGPCLARLPYGTVREATADDVGPSTGESYLCAMASIYVACARMLAPGGFLVVVTKNLRAQGTLRNLAGDTVALCQHVGLDYWQHVIALLAGIGIREGELRARPSFWQLLHARNALAAGERTQLVCHEDVLVFRKPKACRRPRTLKQPQKTTKER
jgi:tRNA G10  N-methylase Trm11